MGTVIQFTPRPRRQRRLQEAPRVLLFVGVHYERWNEDSDAPARQRAPAQPKIRGSRKRA